MFRTSTAFFAHLFCFTKHRSNQLTFTTLIFLRLVKNYKLNNSKDTRRANKRTGNCQCCVCLFTFFHQFKCVLFCLFAFVYLQTMHVDEIQFLKQTLKFCSVNSINLNQVCFCLIYFKKGIQPWKRGGTFCFSPQKKWKLKLFSYPFERHVGKKTKKRRRDVERCYSVLFFRSTCFTLEGYNFCCCDSAFTLKHQQTVGAALLAIVVVLGIFGVLVVGVERARVVDNLVLRDEREKRQKKKSFRNIFPKR